MSDCKDLTKLSLDLYRKHVQIIFNKEGDPVHGLLVGRSWKNDQVFSLDVCLSNGELVSVLCEDIKDIQDAPKTI